MIQVRRARLSEFMGGKEAKSEQCLDEKDM